MSVNLLKCAVVDDSLLQSLLITKLISTHPSLELVGEYRNGVEAHRGLQKVKTDLLFLDIEMPLVSGFDFLDKLTVRPLIIFITGKTDHAFKAFNYDAVDYLQKPIKKERFLNAAQKAITTHSLKGDLESGSNNFIFIKSNLKKQKVYLNELRYIQALGDYAKIVTNFDSLVVLSTMKAFESQLPEHQFLRIHKSYIVNISKVTRFNSKSVDLDKNEKLPLSRNRKNDLKKAMENSSMAQ